MKLFFSAGEPSGDLHTAALIQKLRAMMPDVECVGFGGPKMQQAGCLLLADLTRMAIMWFFQAITHYFKFRALLQSAKRYFETEKVDAVILVDYPGFNWHVAKAAKECGIPVYYFMPPQIWSWAQWRIKKMRARVDGILCPLEFEQRWFEQQGCQTIYIGHPFFEETRKRTIDRTFLENLYEQTGEGPVITILPGSRNQEVKKNLDEMLLTIEYVRSAIPNIRPVFAAFNTVHAEYIQERLTELELNIPIFVGRATELIGASECCLAVSGSVSLEALSCNKPTVIYYRIGAAAQFIQRFFRRTRYITLVNMLHADRFRDPNSGTSPLFYDDSVKIIPEKPAPEDWNRMLFPEFLVSQDSSREAAAYLIHWLSDPAKLALQKRRLRSLLHAVDNIESPLERAAAAILTTLR